MSDINVNEDCKLKGKTILFLGSSVTRGEASQGVSFADFLCERNGCKMIKEAVSGTTLVNDAPSSYVNRMEKLDIETADYFVCQLSTNDATQKKELGHVSNSMDISNFDTKTVAGAIEYIVAYVETKWNCPIVFYTNPQYDSEEYEKMVILLEEISEKWKFHVVNLWRNIDFNNVTDEERVLYMADPIHPTRDGYLKWWTPYFEASSAFWR